MQLHMYVRHLFINLLTNCILSYSQIGLQNLGKSQTCAWFLERKSVGTFVCMCVSMYLFSLSHQGPARKPEAYRAGSHYLHYNFMSLCVCVCVCVYVCVCMYVCECMQVYMCVGLSFFESFHDYSTGVKELTQQTQQLLEIPVTTIAPTFKSSNLILLVFKHSMQLNFV